MAITKIWQVNTMERDLSDGHINKVIYRVKGMDGGVEKARETGEVKFTKPSSLPSDFIPYVQGEVDSDGNVTKAGTPDEATVLGWVKTAEGTDRVAAIEKSLEDQIALINTPITATGKPF